MSKAARNRAVSARERIAAQQAAARRAERRRQLLIGGGSVLAVIVVVVALVVAKAFGGSPGHQSTARSSQPTSVQKDIESVPAATLASVGAGSVASYNKNMITKISGSPLTENGKPEMIYIGAEFCPYCAAGRWAMAVALSRFGTLSKLSFIHSSSTDTDPNTPTMTFYKTTYTSKYLSFDPAEHQDVNRNPLQPLDATQNAVWARYTPGGASQEGYPFVDFGNQYAIVEPFVDPTVLAGKTWAQVATALHDPSSPIAQAEDGAANYITAAICKITKNQPASVCAAAPVSTIEASL
jgi:Domain of unknown function (DUF929)